MGDAAAPEADAQGNQSAPKAETPDGAIAELRAAGPTGMVAIGATVAFAR